MKGFKRLSLLMALVLMMGALAGCGGSKDVTNTSQETTENTQGDSSSTSDANKVIEITMLNSKGEIQAQLEEAAKAFSEDNPNIKLDIIVAEVGQSPFEKISVMYAAGNAPALAMLDPVDIPNLADKFLDLSNEKWVSDAVNNSLDNVTLDGKVMGFPLSVEGSGFIYNKTILDQAGVDPTAIKTTKDLEEAFKKVKAAGFEALAISPMDWSLGAHFLPIAYSTQSSDSEEVNRFLNELKAGNIDLKTNKAFNGLMDTFDMMKQYNMYKNDPLAATYESNQQAMGSGEVGFWFMGNWTWPQIYEFAQVTEGFGFIPVPISNNPDDYGNSGIPVGMGKYIGIDKENNNEEQQAAAKKFLEWLVYSEKGQDFFVNKANLIPAFKNITLEPQDPLAKSIKEYMTNGKTIQVISTLPADHWAEVGASMQKYLVDMIDRDTLIEEIQAYWKNVK
ncbi:MAG: extracellular solute-binding protein family 1 [Defluviitaleaceae bacterium]|jgi:raffinose/stachyose/melibiose transport system substrate-binding protein|nr:extracellular solute-binding protein family 1 [Defluviitaleaceae bacterium]